MPVTIAVLTSGGDAPGMNAALRAVVRTALARGATVYAIHEGYQGMVEGGERIRQMSWDDVGGIMHRGGTVIGTARSADFRHRPGRLRAARNLVERGIDRLIVIGGDGSLTGANTFRREWPGLLADLVASGQISAEHAARHPFLGIVGLVGSIDNDFYGTDMTIGADTALHRITDALDAISSTAASHQRTFVVEVMGRNCGYLALMGAVAGSGDWVFIPERPPESDNWAEQMCDILRAGREAGRRDTIVVVAEGARDHYGNPITGEQVARILSKRLDEDVRVTILGHVQRGGSPSAFDRWMSTLVGHAAAEELLTASPEQEPQLIGMRYNRVRRMPLMECVAQTRAVAQAIEDGDYKRAMELRSSSFTEMWRLYRVLAQALPAESRPERVWRFAVLHAGGVAPGMNTAVRAAVRVALNQGHRILAVRNGFEGLLTGQVEEFHWTSVSGWGTMGGAELGTSRKVPTGNELAVVAATLEAHSIEALLIIGGNDGYTGAYQLLQARDQYPAFRIPMICMPVTINNDLPNSELSVGADTALNSIVEALDKIKQSAVAVRRCFVVEVMGRYCGYLALMSGLASGAERVYLHEEGVRLADLQVDLNRMIEAFRHGKRLSLVIRNERANPLYTTEFLCALFEEEGKSLFDVRPTILGHIQQGGTPTPYDRIQATRLAARCMAFLSDELERGGDRAAFIGFSGGKISIVDLAELPDMVDQKYRRPREQWWLELRPVAELLGRQAVE